MKPSRYILYVVAIQAFLSPLARADEEILPAVSAEKMSEYKNAFGKAISESRAKLQDGPGQGLTGNGPRPGRIDSGLSGVTRRLRENLDKGGPGPGGPGGGPGAFPPGPPKGMPGGGPPPPGFGGPGTPGGPPPPGGAFPPPPR